MELKKRLLKTKEAASYLSISPWKIRQFVHDGALPHIQMGEEDSAGWRFDISDLDKFVDSRRSILLT